MGSPGFRGPPASAAASAEGPPSPSPSPSARRGEREEGAAALTRGEGGPAPDPALADEDVLAGAMAARLQGFPPADDADAEPFWTWRPGEGPPVPAPTALEHGAAASLARPAAQNSLDRFFYRADEACGPLDELGPASEVPAAGLAASGVLEEFLAFRLGGETFAVAIPAVREVVRAPPITEVPRAPAHVLGVVTVRGEVIAVFDPRRRLGLPPAAATGGGRIVIVDGGLGSCGLLVDAVSHVVRLPAGSIEPCPSGVAGPNAELIVGVGRERDRLFTVLDVSALLAPGREQGSSAGPGGGGRPPSSPQVERPIRGQAGATRGLGGAARPPGEKGPHA